MESEMLKSVVANGYDPPNFPRNLLLPFSKLKTEAAVSFRKLVPVYQTICCHITKRCSLHTHPFENLKYHKVWNAYL